MHLIGTKKRFTKRLTERRQGAIIKRGI